MNITTSPVRMGLQRYAARPDMTRFGKKDDVKDPLVQAFDDGCGPIIGQVFLAFALAGVAIGSALTYGAVKAVNYFSQKPPAATAPANPQPAASPAPQSPENR